MIKRKWLASSVGILLLASSLVGCSSSEAPKKEEPKASATIEKLSPVTLKILLAGKRPAGMDEVIAEAEKRMLDTLNVKLNITFVTFADIMQKQQLILSSGEDIDLMFDNQGLGLVARSIQGQYEPLEKLLEQFGPNILKNRPKEMWDANKIKGQITAIPLSSEQFKARSFLVRQDIREKLGIAPIKTYEDLVKFLYAVKDKEKETIPYTAAPGSTDLIMLHALSGYYGADIRPTSAHESMMLYFKNNDGKVYSLLDQAEPKIMELFKENRKLFTDGVINPDSLGVKNVRDLFKSGKTAVVHSGDWIVKPDEVAALVNNVPAAKVEIVTLYDPSKKKVSNFQAGNFITVPKQSKNKERAIMFLNWANEKANFDLLAYGIQGKHWEPVGDDKYKPGAEAGKYGWFPWGWITNPALERIDSSQTEAVINNIKWARDAKNFIPDVLIGFTFDSSPVANEVAQLNSFFSQYYLPLAVGAIDTDKYFTEFKTKADPVIKKVQAEMQQQIDTFLKAKTK